MSALATSSLATPVSRRSADYHPTIWGNRFIQYVSEPLDVDEKMEENIIVLKEKVRKMLVINEKPLNYLTELIDSLQRLGLFYHFEREIAEVLQHIHNNYVENGIITVNGDLHSLALIFRLLRQQGYHISPDVFSKFKDMQETFDEKLITDVEGMINLYEATHLRIQGEDILDEAFIFTSTNLRSMITKLSPFLSLKVQHCLHRPLHKNLQRLEAQYFISTYQEDPSHDETLLLLAKLDFNKLQKLYQKEVGNISKWWTDLDFATKLPFARDRIIEAYFWSLGVCFEPQYFLCRRFVTKVISIATTIDDLYDVYGTYEELQLFTEAIQRWDISYMEVLPEYIQHCYRALLDIYEEAEKELTKEGKAFGAIYAKKEMKRLVQAYFAEAQWLKDNYSPSFEEYMDVALISCGYFMVTSASFMGMGSIITENTFQWFANEPKILGASNVICRLMDDMASREFEQQRGHVASAVECYMKQNRVTKQDAIDALSRQVTNAWKDINEELLDPAEVPKPLLMIILNLARVIDVLYKYGDCYTNSTGTTKNNIEALLLNPWPV